MVRAVHAVEPQPQLRVGVPLRRHRERLGVRAGGILVRHVRRVHGKRVHNVGVLGPAVAVELPVRRDRDRGPRFRSATGRVGRFQRAAGVVEPPRPVETQRCAGQPVGPRRQRVASKHCLVGVVGPTLLVGFVVSGTHLTTLILAFLYHYDRCVGSI